MYKYWQYNCSSLVSFRKLGEEDSSQEEWVLPKKLLPHSQTSCKILVLLWSELRDLSQCRWTGREAQLTSQTVLSLVQPSPRGTWTAFSPTVILLANYWGLEGTYPTFMLGSESFRSACLGMKWNRKDISLHWMDAQFSFLVLVCILERTYPLQSGGGPVFGSHTSSSFMPEGKVSVM